MSNFKRCPTCGVITHKRRGMLGLSKLVPVTVAGEVMAGRCLICQVRKKEASNISLSIDSITKFTATSSLITANDDNTKISTSDTESNLMKKSVTISSHEHKGIENDANNVAMSTSDTESYLLKKSVITSSFDQKATETDTEPKLVTEQIRDAYADAAVDDIKRNKTTNSKRQHQPNRKLLAPPDPNVWRKRNRDSFRRGRSKVQTKDDLLVHFLTRARAAMEVTQPTTLDTIPELTQAQMQTPTISKTSIDACSKNLNSAISTLKMGMGVSIPTKETEQKMAELQDSSYFVHKRDTSPKKSTRRPNTKHRIIPPPDSKKHQERAELMTRTRALRDNFQNNRRPDAFSEVLNQRKARLKTRHTLSTYTSPSLLSIYDQASRQEDMSCLTSFVSLLRNSKKTCSTDQSTNLGSISFERCKEKDHAESSNTNFQYSIPLGLSEPSDTTTHLSSAASATTRSDKPTPWKISYSTKPVNNKQSTQGIANTSLSPPGSQTPVLSRPGYPIAAFDPRCSQSIPVLLSRQSSTSKSINSFYSENSNERNTSAVAMPIMNRRGSSTSSENSISEEESVETASQESNDTKIILRQSIDQKPNLKNIQNHQIMTTFNVKPAIHLKPIPNETNNNNMTQLPLSSPSTQDGIERARPVTFCGIDDSSTESSVSNDSIEMESIYARSNEVRNIHGKRKMMNPSLSILSLESKNDSVEFEQNPNRMIKNNMGSKHCRTDVVSRTEPASIEETVQEKNMIKVVPLSSAALLQSHQNVEQADQENDNETYSVLVLETEWQNPQDGISFNYIKQAVHMPQSPDAASSMLDLLKKDSCNIEFTMLIAKQFSSSELIVAKVLQVIRNFSSDIECQKSIIRNGGIEYISKGMWEHSSIEHVQESACAAIWALSADSDSNVKMALLNAGYVEAIRFLVMKSHAENEHVQLWACGALSSLLYNINEEDVSMSSPGVIQSISGILQEHGETETHIFPAVVEWGIRALYGINISICNNEGHFEQLIHASIALMNSSSCHHRLTCISCNMLMMLSYISSTLPEIVSQGAVRAIVYVMSNHTDDAHIQQRCCAIVANLVSEIDALSQTDSRGLVRFVLLAASNHPDNLHVQEHACIALSKFLCHGLVIKIIISTSVINLVLKAMRSHNESSCLCHEACRYLIVLCKNKTTNVSKLMLPILDLMANNRIHEENQESFCTMMAFLASYEHLRSEIIVLEGAVVLTSSMKEHIKNPIIQKMGCLALRNLSMNERALESKSVLSDVVEAILNAMIAHEGCADIQAEACGAIWTITANSESGEDKINYVNTVKYIVRAIQRHSDVRLLEQACGALWSLSIFNPNIKAACVKDDWIRVIFQAMSKFSNSLVFLENACGLLSTLSTDVECSSVMYSQGGIKVIVETMEAHLKAVDIQQYCCLTIRNMAAGSQEIASALTSSVKSIINAMKHHDLISAVQQEGCGALWSISVKGGENKEFVTSAGGIDVVLDAMDERKDALGGEDAFGAFTELVTFGHVS